MERVAPGLPLSARNTCSTFVLLLVLTAGGVLPAAGPCPDDRLPPELCTSETRSDFGMVATGSPEATRAAVDILERGGNAIDAAVAAALALGVVDSDASGLGGSTNMLVRLASGRTLAIDGTSFSPLAIDIERFREFKASGRAFGYETIAVPTTLATLEAARVRYGTMDLATLLQPAIDLADHGFRLSQIQILYSKKYYEDIMASTPYMRFVAMRDGRTIDRPGDLRCKPDLARTLRHIAEAGAHSFYRGQIARRIAADIIRGGGFVTRSDLAAVRIREVLPLHTTYRGFDVYSFPPPGGGAGVIAALNILENFPSDTLARDTVSRHQVLIEAFRIAAADSRDASHSGSHFGDDPLSKRNGRARAGMIVPGKIVPEESLATAVPPECEAPGESTTQISVADSWGNIVSLTQTLNRSFGSKVATPELGFPYNSFLELYNADKPQCPGYLQPNSPCRTDMAPTIVLNRGELFVALGTPGSNRIPSVVVNVISNMIDRGMGVRDAVMAPRVLWGGMLYRRAYLEAVEPITEREIEALEKIGYEGMTVLRFPGPDEQIKAKFGGVNAISFDPVTGSFLGVGDPRRWGSAMGPRVVPAKQISH